MWSTHHQRTNPHNPCLVKESADKIHRLLSLKWLVWSKFPADFRWIRYNLWFQCRRSLQQTVQDSCRCPLSRGKVQSKATRGSWEESQCAEKTKAIGKWSTKEVQLPIKAPIRVVPLRETWWTIHQRLYLRATCQAICLRSVRIGLMEMEMKIS